MQLHVLLHLLTSEGLYCCAAAETSVCLLPRAQLCKSNSWTCVYELSAYAGEDDGHLVTFTQNQTNGASEMRVYDAKTMDETPTASVQLPIRCPSGFHCYHMSEEQFQAQDASCA